MHLLLKACGLESYRTGWRGIIRIVAAVAFDDLEHVGWALRQINVDVMNKCIAWTRRDGRVMLALEANRRTRLGIHAAPAQRAGDMGRVDLDAIFKFQQAVEDAVIERVGPLFALYRQVGPRNVANK